MELYQGVMYQTYRKHVCPVAHPNVIILSALHGFIGPDTVLAPYEQRMTKARSAAMVSNVAEWMQHAPWPREIDCAFFAGGALYRAVMHAAIARLVTDKTISKAPAILETTGTIGRQRSQLGAYLRNWGADSQTQLGEFFLPRRI